jgi:NADH-quinone oxidoreductase subunit J
MVLYVFVVSYIGGADQPIQAPGPGLRILAPLAAAALFVELCIAVLGSGLKALNSEGATLRAGFGSPEQIGELLLTRFLLAFEVASYLLLVAAVGAVVLARRRRGLEPEPPPHTIAAADLVRSGVRPGTMAEAGGIPAALGAGKDEEEEPAGERGW